MGSTKIQSAYLCQSYGYVTTPATYVHHGALQFIPGKAVSELVDETIGCMMYHQLVQAS